MLAQAALDVMAELVTVIFGRLHTLPSSPSTPPATLPADPSLHISPGSHPTPLLHSCHVNRV